MIYAIDASLILLTYKGKVLLTIRNNTSPIRSKQDIWSFIAGIRKQKESFDQAIQRKVSETTGILLPQVTLLSHWVYNKKKKYFFHAELTDEQVNNLERKEGEVIDFFSHDELAKLSLDRLTTLFIAKHKDLLEKMPRSSSRNYSMS
ncbi:MAG: NUDIX hydrolase [Candidatus Levybacteria bacterium]|nr:NUDIX hydrolase [Candidatus Levybacteria bacterium]